MDYASTVWHNPLKDKVHLRTLGTVQRTALIRILSAFKTVSTAAIEVESRILPTHLRLKQRAQIVARPPQHPPRRPPRPRGGGPSSLTKPTYRNWTSVPSRRNPADDVSHPTPGPGNHQRNPSTTMADPSVPRDRH
jgi:hypothetical protein